MDNAETTLCGTPRLSVGLGCSTAALASTVWGWVPTVWGWTPQFGVGPPQFGVGSSRFGVVSPRFGVVSPRFGVVSPRFGVGPPQFKIGSPQFGVGSSQFGVGSPRFGVGSRRGSGYSAPGRPDTNGSISQLLQSMRGTQAMENVHADQNDMCLSVALNSVSGIRRNSI